MNMVRVRKKMLEKLRHLSREEIVIIISATIAISVGIYIAYSIVPQYLHLAVVGLIASVPGYYISRRYFERLVVEDLRFIIEISDDFRMHRLIAINNLAFRKIKLERPITISFGNIIYADNFDEERYQLVPSWLHYKIEFLRDATAFARLKKELEEIFDDYVSLKKNLEVLAFKKTKRELEIFLRELEKARGAK